jgi:tRNA nucleotidyltransferase (CCA-adding enzyme)
MTGVPILPGWQRNRRGRCEAPDDELLLVDWLNALILEMAAGHMLFSRFEVTLNEHRLHATVWGEAVDISTSPPSR